MVEAPVFRGSQTSSQVRGHGIELSGSVGTAKEGGVRKGVCVPHEVLVGYDVGASMGDTNEEAMLDNMGLLVPFSTVGNGL